ncbi:unnamed protein product [Acidithrix sp. C25]|nr:unnamed protein product [Acidithrix sp. C25]
MSNLVKAIKTFRLRSLTRDSITSSIRTLLGASKVNWELLATAT